MFPPKVWMHQIHHGMVQHKGVLLTLHVKEESFHEKNQPFLGNVHMVGTHHMHPKIPQEQKNKNAPHVHVYGRYSMAVN